ncbi:hypothetical protein EV193_10232 [Herbihabitans rhizosphaerae]|uniref:Uncharacterized protein n=1 Tax=Herbihabitans rhizosphaerae TaxID=1872711 RepID=A0A4Q7L1W4_9PSEU|nr:hypothetical protein [Herbihabitans rhizosphaerae]RZS43056.1 hypothetical protein EV193_10232 [Herbihabitans rhizosphaerae]
MFPDLLPSYEWLVWCPTLALAWWMLSARGRRRDATGNGGRRLTVEVTVGVRRSGWDRGSAS